jgi:hypothetical protein
VPKNTKKKKKNFDNVANLGQKKSLFSPEDSRKRSYLKINKV